MNNERHPLESEEAAVRPFGIEYLEPVEIDVQAETRGGQEDCCWTYVSGGIMCSDYDICSLDSP